MSTNNDTFNKDNKKDREYTVQGMKFIVTPVFKESGNATIKSVIVNLLKAEAFKSQTS